MLDKIKRIISEGDVVPFIRTVTPDELANLRNHVLIHNGSPHTVYSVQFSALGQRVVHASPVDNPKEMISIPVKKGQRLEVKPNVRNS